MTDARRPPTSESVMPAGVPEAGATTAERFQRLEDQAVEDRVEIGEVVGGCHTGGTTTAPGG